MLGARMIAHVPHSRDTRIAHAKVAKPRRGSGRRRGTRRRGAGMFDFAPYSRDALTRGFFHAKVAKGGKEYRGVKGLRSE